MKSDSSWQVCSLTVQFTESSKADVKASILQIPGTEIVAINERTCTFAVLIESHDHTALYQQMRSIEDISGVLSVSLIYHHYDE